MSSYSCNQRWSSIISRIMTLPLHKDMRIEFSEVGCIPEDFHERIGDSDGQDKDYGFRLGDGTSIHVKVYRDHLKVHRDKRDPRTDPLGHLYHDAPHWLLVLGLAVILAVCLLRRRG